MTEWFGEHFTNKKVGGKMQCNGDCFNCIYPDCVASEQEISKLDYLERKKRREEMGQYIKMVGVEIRERKNSRSTKID